MFQAAEIGHRVKKAEYERQVPEIRAELIQAQHRLKSSDFSVVIVVEGDDRPGCNEVINILHEWLDPRFVEAHVFRRPTDEDRARPRSWRYVRVLPAHGRIGVYSQEWSNHVIRERVLKEIDPSEFRQRLARIRRFEQMLSDNGVLLVKFWLHDATEAPGEGEDDKDAKKKPVSRRPEWLSGKRYARALEAAEELMRSTSTGDSPWHVIESTCRRYRNLALARHVAQALEQKFEKIERLEQADPPPSPPATIEVDPHTILDTVDLTQSLDRDEYDRQLKAEQRRLRRIFDEVTADGKSAVILFEGWDAAGKGGAIRRMTRALDAEDYRVIPIAAPTEEERARPYLWRFYRHMPGPGRLVVFDRSWYGRVLVERVEGFASVDAWQRAYEEINFFEESLVHHGYVLVKFWLHIDPDEQLRRFQEREKIPYKQFKITEDDYRNREKWLDYEHAANEMIARTSTRIAPWQLVPANSKKFARIQVLRTVSDALDPS